MRTLSIDCGGSGIKGALLDEAGDMVTPRRRVSTPYPIDPDAFVEVLAGIAEGMGPFERVTVGLPGIVRHGVIVTTPHYITVAGPHSPIDPQLRQQWCGFDLGARLESLWGVPVRVLNDAQVQGAAVITGTGYEVMFTLGTGLGCAMFDDGRILPKLELSRAPVRKGVIYDEWVGAAARKQIGRKRWEKRVLGVIEGLRPMFVWDRLYLGGGEAKRLRGPLPPDVEVVPNIMGIRGGSRVWDLAL